MNPSRLIGTICVCLSLAVAAPTVAQEVEQGRGCGLQAKEKGLTGKERQDFMELCRKTKPEGSDKNAAKAESCRKQADAQNLKGDARKAFRKNCENKS